MKEENVWIKDLIAAQQEMPTVEKDGKNPHFKNDYAKYDSAVEAIKKVYNKHNFFVSHSVDIYEGDVSELKTKLIHTSGQFLESTMLLINKAGTDQGMGSSITYAKRYTLLALVAVSSGDDDDGNKASIVPVQQKPIPDINHNFDSPPLPSSNNISGDTVMSGGKHKGKSFKELVTHELDYIAWAAKMPDLKGQLADLVDYAVSTGALNG